MVHNKIISSLKIQAHEVEDFFTIVVRNIWCINLTLNSKQFLRVNSSILTWSLVETLISLSHEVCRDMI